MSDRGQSLGVPKVESYKGQSRLHLLYIPKQVPVSSVIVIIR